MPIRTALKIEPIAPKVDPTAKRMRVVYGPYLIKGKNVSRVSPPAQIVSVTNVRQDNSTVGNSHSGDLHGSAYVGLAGKDFPRDITILHTDGIPALRAADGSFSKIKLSDGLYIHHTLFANMNHSVTQFLNCGSTPAKLSPVSVFMAAGLEASEFKFFNKGGSVKSGYYIGPNDNILVNADIVNYNAEPKEAYMVMEMEYFPGKPTGYKDADMVNLDIGMCSGINGLDVHPPAGVKQWSLNGTSMIANQGGYLLHVKGHLHGEQISNICILELF